MKEHYGISNDRMVVQRNLEPFQDGVCVGASCTY